MKKLIAISVVFALAAGVAFAVDLAGTVFGHVNVIETQFVKDVDAKLDANGGMDRVRIDGAGEAGDGKFGGYIRVQGFDSFDSVESVYAYWKPIDQFKLTIGGFGDAFWGKEGVTGWGFNQMPNDCSVATNYGIWCGPYWGSSVYFPGGGGDGYAAFMHNRYVFLEGFQYYGAALEIKPIDVLGINIGIPFITGPRNNDSNKDGTIGDVFQASLFQVDLNFSFGNIALTYDGANRAGMKAGDGGALYLYYGGSFGDLSIDFGLAYHFPGAKDADRPSWGDSDAALPIGIGLGVKYAAGSFGIKFRTTVALGGDDKNTYLNLSLLPYFAINDSISVFLNMGLGMLAPDSSDAYVGFYVNPYLRVGGEWGPTFYVGIQLESPLSYEDKLIDGDPAYVRFSIPIALQVSF
jgi:hypothetical protein